MLAGELPATVLAAAQCENGGRASTGGYHSIPSQGHGQDASAADSQLPRESMRRERPARSARTALRPLPLPRRERKRRGISGSRHDPEMNAEAEGGKLSSQMKTDEYTAWTCLPKILHDQVL